MKARLFFVVGIPWMLGGCASSTKQTDQVLKSPPPISSSAVINDVPFIAQELNHCGPASLAMVLQWAGKDVGAKELAPQVYTPRAQGSFQTELISASRRQGMLAIPIQGLPALLKEIAAGHPVIIFENLAFSWAPQWHYAVVFGYDLNQPSLLMHSGPEKNKVWDMRKFERSWKLANYWGLVVLPPGHLAASAQARQHILAAAALEKIDKLNPAEKIYRSVLQRWPEASYAFLGLANIAYRRKNFEASTLYLKEGLKLEPANLFLLHNLAVAFGAKGEAAKARFYAQKTMSACQKSNCKTYAKSLADWL